MFSCRTRVELVVAGSCSPCVCNVGMEVRPQEPCPAAPSPAGQRLPTQTHKLEVSEGAFSSSERFTYLPRPHVLCILELLLLVVVPLGQYVEQ